MLRIPSPLDDDVEALVQQPIGCCIAVHREVGPGLLERTYVKAVRLEFLTLGVPFEMEQVLPVYYGGQLLSQQRVDFVVGGSVLLEVKAGDALAPIHHAQTLSYLRASKLRGALLVNFNAPILVQGLRRIVL